MMIYNFGAAILRSLGDTKRPFYSLVVAGAINVGLNLLLVIEFEMSVAGVAVATVISNIVNAGIIVFFLTHEKGVFRLELKQLSISKAELKKILQIGVPAGIQGMVFFHFQRLCTGHHKLVRFGSRSRLFSSPQLRILLLLRSECFRPSNRSFHQSKLRSRAN